MSTDRADGRAPVSITLTTPERCTALTANGKPCRCPPLKGTSRCVNHTEAPDVVALIGDARRQGGRERAKQLKVREPVDLAELPGCWAGRDAGDLLDCVLDAARAVRLGKLSARDGNTCAALLGLASSIMTSLEAAEVEEEVEVRRARTRRAP